jgi:hypothetical protein
MLCSLKLHPDNHLEILQANEWTELENFEGCS